jgi:heme oxygenase
MNPGLDRPRLAEAMSVLHGFWAAAEEGLARWADGHADDAVRVDWPQRRRAHLYEADLRKLGFSAAPDRPALPDVRNTDEALGRMYVLEGATLGGTFIDRHLAGLPALSGVRLSAFSPYGERTGTMWRAFRSATREHVAGPGDADRVVDAASRTFAALVDWVASATRLSA